jgi:hypothetical protein
MRKEELKGIIKESIKEVLKEERLNLYEMLIPKVSKKEMQEIEKKYGKKPENEKAKFKNITNWVLQ